MILLILHIPHSKASLALHGLEHDPLPPQFCSTSRRRVVLLQRFFSALNEDVHWHGALCSNGGTRFHPRYSCHSLSQEKGAPSRRSFTRFAHSYPHQTSYFIFFIDIFELLLCFIEKDPVWSPRFQFLILCFFASPETCLRWYIPSRKLFSIA
jgi:hypothetical protein